MNVCSEHQELSRQIQQCTEPRLREDLERELDSVVSRMEAKGEQIGRLRRHQEMVSMRQAKETPGDGECEAGRGDTRRW